MYVCMYVYIYICISILSPLRLLDSNFPGDSLRAWEFAC